MWSVSEIDTAKAKKTPGYIVPGYIQYNGGLYSAGNVFLSAADAWDWIHLFRSYRGISIHALREEGDRDIIISHLCDFVFLSTPSARRATR